jgi:hypothetical protein
VAFLPLFVAADVQLAAGARVEARAGEMPLYAGAGSSGFVTAIVTPTAGILLNDQRSESSVFYAPRLLWRDPPPLQARPLVFHSFVLTLHHRLTRRAELRLQLGGSYGDVDYVALGQLLSSQTTIPSTTRLVAFDSQASLLWQADRRTRLELGFKSMYRRFLNNVGSAASAVPATIPTLLAQNVLRLEPQATRYVTRQDRLGISSELAYYALTSSATSEGSTRLSALAWQPQIFWNNQGRSQLLWLRAGVAVAGRLGEAGISQSWTPLWPVGELGVAWLLREARGLEIRGELTAASVWYLEPVLVAGIPRGLLTASLDAHIGRRWRATLFGQFSTDLTQNALIGTPNETLLIAGLPVRVRLSLSWFLEAGARYVERAPHLSASDFAFRDRELYGYARLAFLFHESLDQTRPRTEPGAVEQ